MTPDGAFPPFSATKPPPAKINQNLRRPTGKSAQGLGQAFQTPALLPRRVKLFWASVRTEQPCFSQTSRCSFSRAVWSMSQPRPSGGWDSSCWEGNNPAWRFSLSR